MLNILFFCIYPNQLNLPQFFVAFGRHILFIRDVDMQNLLPSITNVLAENATIDSKCQSHHAHRECITDKVGIEYR